MTGGVTPPEMTAFTNVARTTGDGEGEEEEGEGEDGELIPRGEAVIEGKGCEREE